MKAVLFDMDGVLVDSEHQWKLVEGPFLSALVGRWGDADHDRIVGLNVEDLYLLLVREYGLKQSRDQFMAESEERAVDLYRTKVSLAHDLHDTLQDLSASKIPVAIASSSPRRWIKIVLDRFGLHPRFPVVVSGEDVSNRTKPFPDIYLRAAELIGVEPGSCVAVEDSSIGVAAAKAAGMYCVAFRSGTNDGQDLSKADCEVRRLRDVAGLHDRLGARP